MLDILAKGYINIYRIQRNDYNNNTNNTNTNNNNNNNNNNVLYIDPPAIALRLTMEKKHQITT